MDPLQSLNLHSPCSSNVDASGLLSLWSMRREPSIFQEPKVYSGSEQILDTGYRCYGLSNAHSATLGRQLRDGRPCSCLPVSAPLEL